MSCSKVYIVIGKRSFLPAPRGWLGRFVSRVLVTLGFFYFCSPLASKASYSLIRSPCFIRHPAQQRRLDPSDFRLCYQTTHSMLLFYHPLLFIVNIKISPLVVFLLVWFYQGVL